MNHLNTALNSRAWNVLHAASAFTILMAYPTSPAGRVTSAG